MARLSLDDNPDACLPLDDESFYRLKRQYGESLWARPHPCQTCDDRGWFKRREPDGSIAEYDCDCEAQWVLHLWLLNAGIGKAYQRLSLRDVPDERLKSVTEALDYIGHIEGNLRLGLGLMLWSELRGTGKTLVATLALKRVLAAGYDGYFTTFSDMLDMYASSWRDKEEKRWFDQRVRNVQFLVIDDIGKENEARRRKASETGGNSNEHSLGMIEAMVDAVVRARNAAALPTIITTNLTPKEIDQGYSVASLLAGTVKPVHVIGRDYRQGQHEESERDVIDGIRRPVVMV